MADELSILYIDAGTPYVRIRRAASVWNGSALVAWDNADVADYVVSLADVGGGYWTGDIPAELPAGTYSVQYFERAGADPDADDSQLAAYSRHWSGTTLSEPSDDAYAVTLAEAKTYLRVTDDAEDADIYELIGFASDFIETETQCAIMAGARALALDEFPAGREIRLPFPPLLSVESVTYIDTDGVTQTLDADTYTVDTTNKPGRVALKSGESWPVTASQANAVTVNFTAGYADAASVPRSFKQAVKWTVGHAYENRESTLSGSVSELPLGVRTLIGSLMFREAFSV